MAPHNNRSISRPLEKLGRLIDRKKLPVKKYPAPLPQGPHEKLSPQQETAMFNEAMADVTPMSCDQHWQWPKHQRIVESTNNHEEQQAVDALRRLIDHGQGFNVADTSEYMEAVSPGTHGRVARQLHKGRYSVQDYVDLHGFTVREADEVMHRFLRRAIRDGKRAVLIVHGRGLTSPHEPVLKKSVYHWLTRGPLRKYVVALTSARAFDGGAGATYVLLRSRPITKKIRMEKRHPKTG